MVISVSFSILGLSLGAGLIIDFVSVRDGLIIAPTNRKGVATGTVPYPVGNATGTVPYF